MTMGLLGTIIGEKGDRCMKALGEYPLNIVRSFSEEMANKTFVAGLGEEIGRLEKRQAEILKYRFRDKMTLEKCGEMFGVSRERARQIEAKALRMLKHPSRSVNYTAVPVARIIEKDEKYRKLAVEYELLKREYEMLRGTRDDRGIETGAADLAILLSTPIKDVDLSNRTYNCLVRSGKKTLKDLTEMDEDDYGKVRNLGKKCIEEIKGMLESYGLGIKNEYK